MVKFPTEDKRGGFGKVGVHHIEMQMINEKSEVEFNDDESRIPFHNDNYMMEKSAMSIHFDFDMSHINIQKKDQLSPTGNDNNNE